MARIARTRTAPDADMASSAGPSPFDVRFMNSVASLVYLLAGAALCGAALFWLWRAPWFPVRAIEIDGDLERNNAATLRANATPKLSGNFFSLDLVRARAAFEAVPWVRNAVVRKVWPDRLAVRLEEHHAAALWEAETPAPDDAAEAGSAGAAGSDKLVNLQGEVFEANVGDVEDESLPTFTGPEGSAAHVLALYRRLAPVFDSVAMKIDTLAVSGRGSWRAEFARGATVDIGRGSDDELVARSERFTRTLGQVLARYQRPLEHADLRYADAYALRLQGISTTVPAPGNRKTN